MSRFSVRAFSRRGQATSLLLALVAVGEGSALARISRVNYNGALESEKGMRESSATRRALYADLGRNRFLATSAPPEASKYLRSPSVGMLRLREAFLVQAGLVKASAGRGSTRAKYATREVKRLQSASDKLVEVVAVLGDLRQDLMAVEMKSLRSGAHVGNRRVEFERLGAATLELRSLHVDLKSAQIQEDEKGDAGRNSIPEADQVEQEFEESIRNLDQELKQLAPCSAKQLAEVRQQIMAKRSAVNLSIESLYQDIIEQKERTRQQLDTGLRALPQRSAGLEAEIGTIGREAERVLSFTDPSAASELKKAAAARSKLVEILNNEKDQIERLLKMLSNQGQMWKMQSERMSDESAALASRVSRKKLKAEAFVALALRKIRAKTLECTPFPK